LFISALYLLPIIFPVFGFLGVVNKYMFVFIPTHQILNLLNYAILGEKVSNLWLDFGLLLIWIGIAFLWAKKWFVKYVIDRTGE